MERTDAYDLIERPRTVRVLMALREATEEVPVSEILEKVGGSRTTGITRLDEFRDAGLVTKRAGDNRTIYSLTEDGEEVAHHLASAISTIMDGDNNNDR